MADFITDAFDGVDANPAGAPRRRQRRRDGATTTTTATTSNPQVAGQQISVHDLLTDMNSNETVSMMLLTDTSLAKRSTLDIVSRQSATAKRLVGNIDRAENVPFNALQAIEFLKLVSDMHDNKFVP
jgi:Protein of unknown function (DUF1098)